MTLARDALGGYMLYFIDGIRPLARRTHISRSTHRTRFYFLAAFPEETMWDNL